MRNTFATDLIGLISVAAVALSGAKLGFSLLVSSGLGLVAVIALALAGWHFFIRGMERLGYQCG